MRRRYRLKDCGQLTVENQKGIAHDLIIEVKPPASKLGKTQIFQNLAWRLSHVGFVTAIINY